MKELKRFMGLLISLISFKWFRMLENRSLSYVDGPIPVPLEDLFLTENVERIEICDTGMLSLFFRL